VNVSTGVFRLVCDIHLHGLNVIGAEDRSFPPLRRELLLYPKAIGRQNRCVSSLGQWKSQDLSPQRLRARTETAMVTSECPKL